MSKGAALFGPNLQHNLTGGEEHHLVLSGRKLRAQRVTSVGEGLAVVRAGLLVQV